MRTRHAPTARCIPVSAVVPPMWCRASSTFETPPRCRATARRSPSWSEQVPCTPPMKSSPWQKKSGADVAKALLGKAVLPDDLPWMTGSIGLRGTKRSWELMSNCDTLLMIGSGFPHLEFLPKEGLARAVQIDLEPEMLSLRYPMEVGLVETQRREPCRHAPWQRHRTPGRVGAHHVDAVQRGLGSNGGMVSGEAECRRRSWYRSVWPSCAERRRLASSYHRSHRSYAASASAPSVQLGVALATNSAKVVLVDRIDAWCPLLTAAMILSGFLVQRKGRGSSLVSRRKRLMAA